MFITVNCDNLFSAKAPEDIKDVNRANVEKIIKTMNITEAFLDNTALMFGYYLPQPHSLDAGVQEAYNVNVKHATF